MKKKILFIAPGYYGFNEVVSEGLKKYSGYKIIDVNSTLPYQYKNLGERIYNFFLKTFLGKNLKEIKKGQYIRQTITQHGEIDLLIVNRPDVLTAEDLHLAQQACKRSVCLFWDSIDKIPSQKNFINSFDTIFSFDPVDCEQFGFKSITNFYFATLRKTILQYDIALLMTYDKRITDAIKLFKYFEKHGIKAKAKIFTYKSHPIKEDLPKNMEVIHTIVPFNKAYEYYLDSKIILDLAHPNQRGLSFRPFEAIGLEKKLITTANIDQADLYHEDNVYIIKDINTIDIPKSFIENDYRIISSNIKEKYFIKNWIQTIIS
ncbi:hypothetical protein [Sphingobacterium sp. UBA5670]|uniref:hypothetical protein n=1 Tax=Sphingobacterium sp. UBA5670 TaxID=1947502 RepID=UPI0025F4681B|nr:hypothetical protein [Sphingobacterium sp. UBA5670]